MCKACLLCVLAMSKVCSRYIIKKTFFLIGHMDMCRVDVHCVSVSDMCRIRRYTKKLACLYFLGPKRIEDENGKGNITRKEGL